MRRWTLHHAKLEDWAASYTGPKFHACLCDPPYGLTSSPDGTKGFMGKEWDTLNARAWGEALKQVLYPGALVLMFGGSRTHHRLMCGIEDAGLEIIDCLMYLYGSGFPKAQGIDRLIDSKLGYEREVVAQRRVKGGGTEYMNRNNLVQGFRPGDYQKGENVLDVTVPSDIAAPWTGHRTPQLKPAYEVIVMARVPTSMTHAEMALEYGSGALNVDAGRIGTNEPIASHFMAAGGHGQTTGTFKETYQEGDNGKFTQALGRYPANVIFDRESAALLDEQSGELISGKPCGLKAGIQLNCYGKYAGGVPVTGFGDSGGASRFFFCAKSSQRERNAGCDDLPEQLFGQSGGAQNAIARGDSAYLDEGTVGLNRLKRVRNPHPTVKAISLTKWLASLLLPPASVQPRRLLVPFAGVASEMTGALLAGWDEVVGIEQDAGYIPIGEARLKWWMEQSRDGLVTDPEAILAASYGPDDDIDRAALEEAGQGSLFV